MANKPSIEPVARKDFSLDSRYVRGEQLLEILFDDESRPSLRWLRSQEAARAIPSVRIGRLVYFDPVAVKLHLSAKRTLKGNAR